MEPLARLSPADLRSALGSYLECLRAHRVSLNRLNVYPVPDADTGTNLLLTVDAVCDELGATGMASTASAIARGALLGARGISGVILSAALRGLAERVAPLEAVDARSLADALADASRSADAAVLDPVEGTILTVARDAAGAADASSGEGLLGVLEAARTAAGESLARTPELLPALKAAGVVDAGGAGFVLLLDALLHVVDGRPLPVPEAVPEPILGGLTTPENDGGDRRYEMACLLEAPDEAIPALREAWRRVAGAVVVVGGDGEWTCHVHADRPGEALEVAAAFGRPRDVRVTDLVLQVVEEHGVPVEPEEEVRTAVVAVGTGDGVRLLFRSLGARVVTGGRSLQPSVAELLRAVDGCEADEVVVLANDERVVPAARTLGDLTDKRVHVLPTRGLAEGLGALHAYDPDAPLVENAARMAEAAAAVRSGEIVRAARNADGDARPIREGEWLGVTREGIRAADSDLAEAAALLLADLVAEGPRVVTILEGEGASEEATDRILDWLRAHRPEAGVQVLHGGQPLHAYVFGVE